MNRGKFLRSLGLSSAALMATYCMGGMTACTKEEPDPNPSSNPNNNNGGSNNGSGGSNNGSKVDFTLDLNETANTKLKTNGEFIYKNNIIIARTNDGNFVALSKECTHQGTTINFEATNNRFNCPNHGSNFSLTGSVVNGPAASPLKQYKTTFNSTANTLRIFEE